MKHYTTSSESRAMLADYAQRQNNTLEMDEDDKADDEDGDLADGPARSNSAADRFEDDEPRSNDWTDWPSSHRGLGMWRMGGAL